MVAGRSPSVCVGHASIGKLSYVGQISVGGNTYMRLAERKRHESRSIPDLKLGEAVTPVRMPIYSPARVWVLGPTSRKSGS